MNKKRLLKLAKLLEKDADDKKGVRFSLKQWATPYVKNKKDDDIIGFKKKLKTVPVSCETTACAVGLACISGAFKDEGLTFTYKKAYWEEGLILEPRYKRKTGFVAVEKFFDIDPDDAEFLFHPVAYPERKRQGAAAERYVAARIRNFVKGNQ